MQTPCNCHEKGWVLIMGKKLILAGKVLNTAIWTSIFIVYISGGEVYRGSIAIAFGLLAIEYGKQSLIEWSGHE